MVNRLLVYICCFFFTIRISAQEALSADTLVHRLWKQTQLYPREKIYARTDRPVYVAGDTLRFSVQVVNFISHRPEGASRYAYAELYKEDSLVYRAKVRGDTLGVMPGDMPLDKELAPGMYQLRAYTRYSAFQKEPSVFTRPLWVLSYKYSGVNYGRPGYTGAGHGTGEDNAGYTVNFYPEGGHGVAGAPCRFGFEAVHNNGSAGEVTGYVVDSRRDTLSRFATMHDGMGEFSFTPRPGEAYEAVCINNYGLEKVFTLPPAVTGSFALRVDAGEDAFRVSLVRDSLPPDAPSRFQLLVLQRGFPLYADAWDGGPRVFPKSAFREGMLHFLLLDKGHIVSERPAFVLPAEKKIECLVAGKAGGRDSQGPTRIELVLQDEDGRPINGVASIAVTREGDFLPDSTINIQTELLLTPDLQGEVRDPGWYFRNAGVPVGREAMDLLVRVRGWRRYEIEPAMQGEYDEPDVLPEVSARVSGRVLDRKGAGVQNCVVTLAAPGTGILEQAVSREDGRFVFTGFEIPEGTRFVVSAKTATGRENVYLVLDEVPSWFEGVPAPLAASGKPHGDHLESAQWQGYRNRTLEKLAREETMRDIFLEEVEVRAPRKTYNTEYEQQAGTVITEERIKQSGLPNLQMVLRALVGIGGLWSPLLVFDGVPVYDSGSADFFLNYLPVEAIGQIDIIKGPHAVGYFNGKHNMIVAVSTKRGGKGGAYYAKTNTGYITPMGYQQPVEVYAPAPRVNKEPDVPLPDLRSVLYWQPRLPVREGRASIDFYPPVDAPVSVVIEGVTREGDTFRGHCSFAY